MSNSFDVRSEPGSAWDKEQLNRLGVEFEEGHKALNLIPRDRALKRSSKIYRNLTEEFGLSWSEVTSGPHGSRDYSLYDALEFLGRKRSPALIWKSSSPSARTSSSKKQNTGSLPIMESPLEHKPKRR